uniref:Uncharacterized protein n=1 Tax=Acrobeloides nanus TaxID=290746 RepID=A0A914CEP3_9BILA
MVLPYQRTTPGLAKFRGIVGIKPNKTIYDESPFENLSEMPSRFDMYMGQICDALPPPIDPLCYCKDQKNKFRDPKIGHRIDIYHPESLEIYEAFAGNYKNENKVY